MMRYELNKNNLALLGVLDDFYQLYFDLDEVFYSNYHDRHSVKGIDNKARSDIRKLLDAFLADHTYLFTSEYPKIHPNCFSINRAQLFYEFKKIELLRLRGSICNFTKFLQIFQDLVVQILCQRKSYTHPCVSEQAVFEALNAHIQKRVMLTEKTLQEVSHVEPSNSFLIFKSLSSISCNINKHLVIPCWVQVNTLETGETVHLPIHKCLTCGRNFIGIETYKVYKHVHEDFVASFTKDTLDDKQYLEYYGESELHRAGYNVVASGMTTEQRHMLLKRLIDSGTLTEFQIKRDIEKAIRIFNGNSHFALAIKKWQCDLLFVSEYVRGKIS